jgi:glutathione S-transferase
MLRQRDKLTQGLDALEALAQEKTWLNAERLTLADIATGCALGYLNFRHILPNWCVQRPALVKLAERLFARESFARTAPP